MTCLNSQVSTTTKCRQTLEINVTIALEKKVTKTYRIKQWPSIIFIYFCFQCLLESGSLRMPFSKFYSRQKNIIMVCKIWEYHLTVLITSWNIWVCWNRNFKENYQTTFPSQLKASCQPANKVNWLSKRLEKNFQHPTFIFKSNKGWYKT